MLLEMNSKYLHEEKIYLSSSRFKNLVKCHLLLLLLRQLLLLPRLIITTNKQFNNQFMKIITITSLLILIIIIHLPSQQTTAFIKHFVNTKSCAKNNFVSILARRNYLT